VRRLLPLLALLALPAPAEAACRTVIEADGRYFSPVELTRTPALGAERPAVVPGCNDTPGDGREDPDRPIATRLLAGAPASVARQAEGRTWVAEDTAIALQSHPLHRFAPRLPAAPRRGCRDVVTTVTAYIGVVFGDRRGTTTVVLLPHARVTGPRIDGVHRFAPLSRWRASARRCPGDVLVVRSLRRR
jgi:hypothetical protein